MAAARGLGLAQAGSPWRRSRVRSRGTKQTSRAGLAARSEIYTIAEASHRPDGGHDSGGWERTIAYLKREAHPHRPIHTCHHGPPARPPLLLLGLRQLHWRPQGEGGALPGPPWVPGADQWGPGPAPLSLLRFLSPGPHAAGRCRCCGRKCCSGAGCLGAARCFIRRGQPICSRGAQARRGSQLSAGAPLGAPPPPASPPRWLSIVSPSSLSSWGGHGGDPRGHPSTCEPRIT